MLQHLKRLHQTDLVLGREVAPAQFSFGLCSEGLTRKGFLVNRERVDGILSSDAALPVVSVLSSLTGPAVCGWAAWPHQSSLDSAGAGPVQTHSFCHTRALMRRAGMHGTVSWSQPHPTATHIFHAVPPPIYLVPALFLCSQECATS